MVSIGVNERLFDCFGVAKTIIHRHQPSIISFRYQNYQKGLTTIEFSSSTLVDKLYR